MQAMKNFVVWQLWCAGHTLLIMEIFCFVIFVQLLYLEWARIKNMFKKQPLWLIKKYFGDKVTYERYRHKEIR
jgi:hypothetical protein